MSDVVCVAGRVVAMSTHAVERYRQRVDRSAKRADVLAALGSGEVRMHKPGWVSEHCGDAAAWVVLTDVKVAFPLRVPREKSVTAPSVEFIAATCLTKRRMSKADVRWLREQAREDVWAA